MWLQAPLKTLTLHFPHTICYIYIHYHAYFLQVADTTERDELARRLAREEKARRDAEMESAQTRLKLQMAREEVARLRAETERARQQQENNRCGLRGKIFQCLDISKKCVKRDYYPTCIDDFV